MEVLEILLSSENVLTAMVVIAFLGFGLWFGRSFWPWAQRWLDRHLESRIALAQMEIEHEAQSHARFAQAIERNNAILERYSVQLTQIHALLVLLTEGKYEGLFRVGKNQNDTEA